MPTYLVGLIETPTQKKTFGKIYQYNRIFGQTHGSISKYILFLIVFNYFFTGSVPFW